MESARQTAVERAVCPICFDDLHSLPDQVGALTLDGRRVEAALYHRSCVCGTGGRLKLPRNVSPITRKSVNGFCLMPPISDRRAWISFVDWNGDGRLAVEEVAVVMAAILPIDESGAEDFVRNTWDKNRDGVIDSNELEREILPYLQQNGMEIATAAPAVATPTISSSSTRQELLAWFSHWDADGSSTLEMNELRYALVSCFFRTLGEADAETKELVVGMFLNEADINRDGSISKSEFLDRLVPLLQANLPGAVFPTASSPHAGESGPLRVRLLAVSGEVQHAELPRIASVGDLRQVARHQFGGEVNLFFAGRALQFDGAALTSIPGLTDGTTVQVLPGARLASAPPMQHQTQSQFSTSAGSSSAVNHSDQVDLSNINMGFVAVVFGLLALMYIFFSGLRTLESTLFGS